MWFCYLNMIIPLQHQDRKSGGGGGGGGGGGQVGLLSFAGIL